MSDIKLKITSKTVYEVKQSSPVLILDLSYFFLAKHKLSRFKPRELKNLKYLKYLSCSLNIADSTFKASSRVTSFSK